MAIDEGVIMVNEFNQYIPPSAQFIFLETVPSTNSSPQAHQQSSSSVFKKGTDLLTALFIASIPPFDLHTPPFDRYTPPFDGRTPSSLALPPSLERNPPYSLLMSVHGAPPLMAVHPGCNHNSRSLLLMPVYPTDTDLRQLIKKN